MKTLDIINNIQPFLNTSIDNAVKDIPMLDFISPILHRIVNKNINKLEEYLKLVEDANGDIDIKNIISELENKLDTVNTFTYNTNFINFNIGKGNIELDIKGINKKISFNKNDIDTLKTYLID